MAIVSEYYSRMKYYKRKRNKDKNNTKQPLTMCQNVSLGLISLMIHFDTLLIVFKIKAIFNQIKKSNVILI